MNTAIVAAGAYARAVEIPGLDPERQVSLVEHIQSRNQALSNSSPITPAVARYAAVLLAADPDHRLASPTALAQAEVLAGLPEIGPALIRLQEGVMGLGALEDRELVRFEAQRAALQRLLRHVLKEVSDLMKRLDKQPA